MEFVPEFGAVVGVDETETPRGAPVVGSDPVTEVRVVGVRDAERPSVACFTVVSDAFDVEDPQGVSGSVRVRRFEARRVEEHLQIAEHRRVDAAVAVASRNAHRGRDFREVP